MERSTDTERCLVIFRVRQGALSKDAAKKEVHFFATKMLEKKRSSAWAAFEIIGCKQNIIEVFRGIYGDQRQKEPHEITTRSEIITSS